MRVELLHVTPLEILVKAIRKCYDSGERSDSFYPASHKEFFALGPKDKALILQVIQAGHTSTLEHINITFDMSGYSRALLQEKSRHRMAAVSEKSTRYCLKELKNEAPFGFLEGDYERACKYLVMTDVDLVDIYSIQALENLRKCVEAGIPNDKSKFCLPDSLKSTCIFTQNFRGFRNLLGLRDSAKALWEFQLLARMMYEATPDDYKFLINDCIREVV